MQKKTELVAKAREMESLLVDIAVGCIALQIDTTELLDKVHRELSALRFALEYSAKE